VDVQSPHSEENLTICQLPLVAV